MKYQLILEFETKEPDYKLSEDELVNLRDDIMHVLQQGAINRTTTYFPDSVNRGFQLRFPPNIEEPNNSKNFDDSLIDPLIEKISHLGKGALEKFKNKIMGGRY